MMELIDQDDNFFNVKRDDGSTWKVAKEGLSEARSNWFNELPQMQTEKELPSMINAENLERQRQGLEPLSREQLALKEQNAPVVASTDNATPQVNTVEPTPDPNNFILSKNPEQENIEQNETDLARNNLAASIQGEATAEAQGAEIGAYFNDQALAERQQIENDYDRKREQIEADRIKAEKDYQDASKEYLESKEIDQGRFWDNKSTGEKIGMAVGLIFASLNPQSMQMALGAINKAVDRDIQSQKESILRKKDNVKEKRGLLNTFSKKFSNLDTAESAAKMAALEKVKLQLESTGLRTKSRVMQEKANQAIAKIDLELAKEKKKFDNGVVNIGGYTGRNIDKTSQKEFASTLSDLQTAEQGINRLLEINEVNGKSFSPSLRAESETIQKSLVGLLRQPITGPGAMSDGERQMLEDIIANPTDLFSLDSTNKVKLKKLKELLQNATKNKARNIGLSSTKDRLGFKAK